MKLRPYVRQFFAPSNDGSAGLATPPAPVSNPPAPSEVTPPAPSDPPPLDVPKPSELDDFVNPDIPDGTEPPPSDQPAKPDPKDKKEEPKKPDPKGTPKEPPIEQFRREYAETKKQRDELQAKVDNHPEVARYKAELEAKQSELNALAEEKQRIREQLDLLDPLANEARTKLHAEFNERFVKRIDFLPKLQAPYRDLVTRFAGLDRQDRGKYQAELEAFEKDVEQLVGPNKLQAALELIRDGADFVEADTKLATELKSKAGRNIFEARQRQFVESDKLTQSHLSKALELPEDIKTGHPFHPLNFVLNARGVLDDKSRAADTDYERKVDKFIAFAASGVSPQTLQQYDELPPAERAEKLREVESRRIEAAEWVRKQAKRAAFYERYLPGLLADYAKLREQAEKKNGATPPDPNDPGKKKAGSSGSELNLEEFEPPKDQLNAL